VSFQISHPHYSSMMTAFRPLLMFDSLTPPNVFPMCSHTHKNSNLQKPFLSDFPGSFFSGTFTKVLVFGIWKECCGGTSHWSINHSVSCSSRIDPNWHHQYFERTMNRRSDFSLLPQTERKHFLHIDDKSL